MSNPGVITLASLMNVGRNIKRLDIEDNIGEAIHVHLNSIRLDFSVEEFLDVSEQLVNAALSLDVFQKYELGKLDPFFLFEMSDLIKDIRRVEVKNCNLRDLKSLVRVRVPKIGTVMLPKPINYSPAYLYLNGDRNSFINYVQYNYPRVDNVARLKKLCKSIKENGYPYNSNYIVLFGNQKIIRDGQHRAAILASLGGIDQNIPVMIFHFDGNRWRIKPYQQLLKAFSKKFAIYVLHKVKCALQRFDCRGGSL